MRIDFTPRARKDYQSLPEPVRKQAKKQLSFLIDDLRHPSLNAKKYQKAGEGVWQARTYRDYRFHFLIEPGTLCHAAYHLASDIDPSGGACVQP